MEQKQLTLDEALELVDIAIAGTAGNRAMRDRLENAWNTVIEFARMGGEARLAQVQAEAEGPTATFDVEPAVAKALEEASTKNKAKKKTASKSTTKKKASKKKVARKKQATKKKAGKKTAPAKTGDNSDS